MIGTLTALVLALLFVFSPLGQVVATTWNPFAITLIVVASLIVLLLPLILALSWSPLQRAEKHLTPRLLELKRHDKALSMASAWLILFPLASYALALLGSALEVPLRTLAWAVWLVSFGISLDVLQHLLKRLVSYLNPYAVLGYFTHAAKSSIQNDREIDFCDVIDALSEMANKSIQQSGTALGLEVLGRMQEIMRHFFEASKSLTHKSHDLETERMGISDKASYTLFYVLQRVELLSRLAAEKQLEPVCSSAVTNLGKIMFHAAKFDISLAAFPAQSLGKCSLFAEEKQMAEVGVKATITLLEVSKTILQEIDVTYLELKETFTSVVNQMNAIAKEAFKQDKTLSIALLKQPFRQLRELFTSEKMASHADTPVILVSIDNAIAEFDALEMVMRTIPPIPTLAPAEPSPPQSV